MSAAGLASAKNKRDSAREITRPTVDTHGRTRVRRLRAIGVGLLVAISVIALGLFVVVHWAERQVFTTDNWVALVSPLPKQPVVSTALGNYIGDQVFNQSAVQNKITDALPPRAAFLAGPLTGQLNSLTKRTAQNIVASNAFQSIWTTANRVAMDRLVARARNQPTSLQTHGQQKFNLTLTDTTNKLRDALGNVSQAIPAVQSRSPATLTVSTNLRVSAQRVHQIIRAIDFLSAVLPLAIVASFLTALAYARHRRRLALMALIATGALMFLELIAIKLLRQATLNQVQNSANLAAVGYVYDTLVGWLKSMQYIVIVGVVVAGIGLLLTGPATWAIRLRSLVHTDRLRTSRAVMRWHETRNWVRRREYYMWVGTGVGMLIIVSAIGTVTGRVVVNAVLLALSVLMLVHIVATPHTAMADKEMIL